MEETKTYPNPKKRPFPDLVAELAFLESFKSSKYSHEDEAKLLPNNQILRFNHKLFRKMRMVNRLCLIPKQTVKKTTWIQIIKIQILQKRR